jgi:hypothetical protein
VYTARCADPDSRSELSVTSRELWRGDGAHRLPELHSLGVASIGVFLFVGPQCNAMIISRETCVGRKLCWFEVTASTEESIGPLGGQ